MADTAQARPLEVDDLTAFALVNDPQLSPDGQRVAYVITTLDVDKDEYRSAIYVQPVAGGAARRFTAGSRRDTSPRWSPDGRWLAFSSDRSGKSQLYVMPAGGGEAWQVTKLRDGTNSEPVWSPDSRRLAFVGRIAPADPTEWAGKSEEERKKLVDQRPREIAALRYKLDGEGFRDGRVRHLFVVDRDAEQAADLTPITSGDCDNIQPAWSPDGRSIAFISNRTPDRETNDTADVYVVPAEGGEPRQLTLSRGPSTTPVWSPDGSQIAYVGHDNPPEFGRNANDTVWTVPVAGGEPRNLSAQLDQSVGGIIADMNGAGSAAPIWTPDGRAVLFLANQGGNVSLFRADLADGSVSEVIGGDRQLLAVSLAANGERLAYAAATPVDPGQVFVAASDGSGERQLTSINADMLASVRLVAPERITYAAADGQIIEGWVLKPLNFEARQAAGERVPLILQIHGGPHGAYGNAMFFEFQLLASHGFGILYTNPRGSTGYGAAFGDALRGDWGGVDYRDVMAGVDHVLAKGWADPARLGVAGGSYGGYLTNWIIGQTDRFRAAISGRSTANRYSHYGSSDMGFRTGDWEFGGPPWHEGNTAHYLERSPLTYAERVRTPLLLLNQEQDLRCPMEQAEQLFTALRVLGREVEWVRFPNESHGMSRTGKPQHRLYRLRRILGFWQKHLE